MSDAIPRVDIRAQYRELREEILIALEQTLSSGTVILGAQVRAFERAMVNLLGSQGAGVGVGNGTDAIVIALRALGIGPGDEVLTVANTAVATASAIAMTGATPVFCDIHPETLMMDCTDARRRIGSRTRAIIPVHLFGNAVDMEQVTLLAQEHRLKIVEDCAQASGTLFMGRPVGEWGDVGCFSFYPTKNLGAFGDAGLCYTRDEILASAMREIRTYGCDASGRARRAGVNSRMDEVQAAVLLVKLRRLEAHLRARRRVAERYAGGLSINCRQVDTTEYTFHSYCLYVVLVSNRSYVLDQMAKAGIECGIHYRFPLHLMEAFGSVKYGTGSLPHTERIAGEILSLPCHPHMSDASVDRVIKVLNGAV